MNTIVSLNIGGYCYQTTESTLTKHSHTYFDCLLSGNLPTTRDPTGAYFIDRDGQYFAPILTWLRTNELVYNRKVMDAEDILREARFYAISPLVRLLEEKPITESKFWLDCPNNVEKVVNDYWKRHQNSIVAISERLNEEGYLTISIQIIPGHRQDIERPPQLLENGKLGLYMNFTNVHIKRYTRIQALLADHFAKRGLSGYFKPDGEISLTIWWIPEPFDRNNDIVYF
eukprot:TRINITY_DN6055_c0_g1_i1.p1 TRINITY_DN6055_c0_g1~~TRINITY_DN6055_c0_g1_i1.p1  ORF type:complete len:229 (+),score=46.57 TRINITY_DN6055_c0_g1_i1:102-788(+)